MYNGVKNNSCVLDVLGQMKYTIKTSYPFPSTCLMWLVELHVDTCGLHCYFRRAALVSSEGMMSSHSALAPAIHRCHCCR